MREQPLWVSCSSSAIRRLPFGRYQLANALARFAGPPFRAQLPGDLGRLSFVCDLRDTIAREVCFTGRYEPQETQLAQGLLGPGMVVVDVGANWGYFTLVCAHLVADRGRVIALEPHPRLAAMLADNVRENRLPQVAVHRVAAGARAATAAFVGFDERDGNWGVSRAAQDAEAADFESPTVAIDAFLDECNVGRVDLIKIDIEGAEGDAIRGMTDGLARHRYRYALVECHPHELARGWAHPWPRACRRSGPLGIAAGTSITRRRCTAGRRQVPCPWATCLHPSMNASSRPMIGRTSCGWLPARPCRRECGSHT